MYSMKKCVNDAIPLANVIALLYWFFIVLVEEQRCQIAALSQKVFQERASELSDASQYLFGIGFSSSNWLFRRVVRLRMWLTISGIVL